MSKNHFSDADAWRAASFAEVVQSNLHTFSAQCWDVDHVAPFGSLVCVVQQDVELIGCVAQLETNSLEHNTYPFPYRLTQEELRVQQPQIFAYLRTIFQVHVLAYRPLSAVDYTYVVPPVPARIHAFVQQAGQQCYEQVFSQPHFLHSLFAYAVQPGLVDDVLLAMIRHARQRNALSDQAIEQFCETFSLLTSNDYRRLKLFLGRLQSLV